MGEAILSCEWMGEERNKEVIKGRKEGWKGIFAPAAFSVSLYS